MLISVQFNSYPIFSSKALHLLLIYGCDFSNASETKGWIERDCLENYTGIKLTLVLVVL